VGVAEAQAQPHAFVPAVIEALGAGEHELADPIQRVALAAPVAQGLVLHPAAHLVEAPVADPHDVERIRDPGGVVEAAGEPGAVGLGQIGGHHPDALEPPRRPGVEAIGAGPRHLLPSTRSIRMRSSRSTSPLAYMVGWSRVARRNDVSSTPNAVTLPTRSGSSMTRRPCSSTAVIIGLYALMRGWRGRIDATG
jgi:hypothetical protein